MGARLMRVLLSLTTLAVVLFGQSAFGALVITEVMSTSNAPAGNLSGQDWWELTNNGPAAVSLNGYSWEDDSGGASPSGDVAIFPNGISLAVGESLIVHQGTAAAATIA